MIQAPSSGQIKKSIKNLIRSKTSKTIIFKF